MPDAKWYEDMAAAMKEREKCLNAITKWQTQLASAEEWIEQLRTGEADDDNPDTRLATAIEDWKVQQEQAATVIDPSL